MQLSVNQIIMKITALLFLCMFTTTMYAQIINSKKNYLLVINCIDKDSSFNLEALKLQSTFNNYSQVTAYVNKLPAILATKGYPSASVDSLFTTDSTLNIFLFLGVKYELVNLKISSIERKAIDAIGMSDYNNKKSISFFQLQEIEQLLINHYENNGFPFAAVYLDSILIEKNKISATLKIDKGNYYTIDSIRLYGKAIISHDFLQHYLNISNKSGYSKSKLQKVDKRMLELPFLSTMQPSDVTMLGTGAVLNLYLKPKKSSQVNFLVGLQPSSVKTNKIQLTGDVNLDLKNTFGAGESILLKWQQLQPQSPRLNIGFSKPYLFKSPFGFDMLFELFKKDSNFLQVNAQMGLKYMLSANQSGKVFMQWQSNSLLSGAVDTNFIKAEKKLPVNIDVASTNLGINYEWNNTNYRLNPRYGNEINFTALIGTKNIKKNSDIINIKDNVFNYSTLYDSIKLKTFQIRLKLSAAHYFPVGRYSTIKTAVNSGLFYSPDIFRNELFQIGGYKLLRGFDEESIYATRYTVINAEYRLLIGLNAYLSFFTDYGVTKNKYANIDVSNNFFGAGIGMVYETKTGLLNISYAIGKRDDIKFNLREASKIHFGYINYF